jgi:hypothetical protein
MVVELSANDLEQGFVRPPRRLVRHNLCGTVTELSTLDVVSLATNPAAVITCYCRNCVRRMSADLFSWYPDGEPVGS